MDSRDLAEARNMSPHESLIPWIWTSLFNSVVNTGNPRNPGIDGIAQSHGFSWIIQNYGSPGWLMRPFYCVQAVLIWLVLSIMQACLKSFRIKVI